MRRKSQTTVPSLPENHPFVPPGPSDSRAPCPALNTLANHGYLPHDGRNIRPRVLINALQEGYNLTYLLAAFLTYGGFTLLGQFAQVSLDDLCRHNRVEHNASLVHEDTRPGSEYAPKVPLVEYMQALEADSSDGKYITNFDVAKARVRRETESADVDAIHAEIARGEMALVLRIFGAPDEEIPLERLRHWMMKESFPPDWKADHTQSFLQTMRTSMKLRANMARIKSAKTKVL
ncbi:Cloroperoxidase [Neolentinus lepideus HHB14362 ss-1]|uniref:Cloroperoxidase n=1 Tax=Neolentinus lepideus HHB14362 ss-1 TaxID=1314782 RepID=A0A165R3H9_9AGAM|nr:Cloroperoxidase [Neolentinus lepideus HHB14362 ss-1]